MANHITKKGLIIGLASFSLIGTLLTSTMAYSATAGGNQCRLYYSNVIASYLVQLSRLDPSSPEAHRLQNLLSQAQANYRRCPP